ncbi:hypothetical protein GCM10028774_21450 [Spirosoma jeollabukense]
MTERARPRPETRINSAAPVFEFDRPYTFGRDYRHSYMIVAEWVKSCAQNPKRVQESGHTQGGMETFWYFALNGD